MPSASLIQILVVSTVPSVRATLAFARRLFDAISQAHRVRGQRRELERLDDRTLGDLGIRRSEIGSLLAEQSGFAEHTRLRVRPRARARVRSPGKPVTRRVRASRA